MWTPAYDAHDTVRDGAWVAEFTGLLDLTSWPKGMRVIVRKERPHPGAQLRITDVDGHRVTAFATNTPAGGPNTQLPDLELRHRRRARCGDRIRIAKDTGLAALPLHDSTRTRSGVPSSPWPATSSPGCRPSPYTSTKPDGGNPNGYATGSSTCLLIWPEPADESGSTWPIERPGSLVTLGIHQLRGRERERPRTPLCRAHE